jgi:hypothetical protein
MARMDIGTTDLRRSAYESACRDYWLAHVISESGEDHPAAIGRSKTAPRPHLLHAASFPLAVEGLNDDIRA